MDHSEQVVSSISLLRKGSSDEDVERLTGISLLDIIELRADAASAPFNCVRRAESLRSSDSARNRTSANLY